MDQDSYPKYRQYGALCSSALVYSEREDAGTIYCEIQGRHWLYEYFSNTLPYIYIYEHAADQIPRGALLLLAAPIMHLDNGPWSWHNPRTER